MPGPESEARGPRSVADLLAEATSREVMADAPGKSGARIERLTIGGRPYVLEHPDLASDWTMRARPLLG